MNEVVTSTAQWIISTRSSGEVLAARVQGSGIDLALSGTVPGFALHEVETWLAELIGVADETARAASPEEGEPSFSRRLHCALSGLLFFEAELWGGSAERGPCALAFVEDRGRACFGWTGAGHVTLTVDGSAVVPEWFLVRDEQGRVARAFVADPGCSLSVRAEWHSPDAAGTGVIEADWPGRAVAPAAEAGAAVMEAKPVAEIPVVPIQPGTAASVDAIAEESPVASSEPAAESAPERAGSVEDAGAAAADRPRGLWRFRSWMDRLAGPGQRETAPEPIAHDVPGVPELIPESAPASAAAQPESATAQPAVAPESAAPPPVEPQVAVVEPAPAAAALVPPAPPGQDAREPVAPAEDLVTPVPPERASVEPPVVQEAAPSRPPTQTLVWEAGSMPQAVPAPPPSPEPAAGDAEAPAHLMEEPVAAGSAARPRVRRPSWPEPAEMPHGGTRPFWLRPWFVALVVVLLFGMGWLLGRVDFPGAGRSTMAWLRAIGFGPARYEVAVTSRPSGAWVSVDGVDQGKRTPVTLELEPGPHTVVLSLSGVGGSSHTVQGKRGERVALDVELWGSLRVSASEGGAPISVTVDGMPRGYAPLAVDRLSPGIHRLQFSGPGIAPWEQTVEVHVDRTAEIVAQPIVAPGTGLLEVRATLADENGSEPLAGAAVWIDGGQRGVTPLRLELPRGPHSIRVQYGDEEAPIQVIDLPGGNQRFATFELGLETEHPSLVATLPGPIPFDRPTVLSASMDRVRPADVREMWLHVRTPEGAWRRYPMTVMKATGGVVGVVVFPTVLFDARGKTIWYVSALAPTGDEYFTEMQPAVAATR